MTTSATKHREFLDAIGGMGRGEFMIRWPLEVGIPNLGYIWDQARADECVPRVLRHSADSRFRPADFRVLWLELRGPVNLTPWLPCTRGGPDSCPNIPAVCCQCSNKRTSNAGIDWVILSGSPDGPTDLAWLRRVVADCRAAGVPVWVRNIGVRPRSLAVGYRDIPSGRYLQPFKADWPISDPTGSDPAEWPQDLRVFEVPKCFEEA